MIAFGLLLTVVVIFGSLAFQLKQRRERSARFSALTLTPNCLLTRYPIAFISGPRTVFRLFDHWNDVPLFLREHGYEVYVIEPTGRTLTQRVASIEAALTSLGSLCHIIADGSLENDLAELVAQRPREAATFTLVRSRDRKLEAASPRASDLRPKGYDIFEVDAAATPWSPKLILLSLHNALVSRRTLKVHPLETAEITFDGFKSEQRFLDLAISLAERDVIASD